MMSSRIWLFLGNLNEKEDKEENVKFMGFMITGHVIV